MRKENAREENEKNEKTTKRELLIDNGTGRKGSKLCSTRLFGALRGGHRDSEDGTVTLQCVVE